MTPIEKAIRDFCGHHADWWPSTTQVQEMLALAQPCPTCEALARTVMLDQTSHDQFKPDWDAMAVMVEKQQCMAKRILELEALAQPEQEPVKDWIASHNDICALLRQAHDALALTSYPPQPKKEPVAFASHGVINWIADKQFQHEADLYTTPPQHESTCAECDKNQSDGWALYCVDCLREFYKHDPTNKRTWVGLTDDEIYKIAVTLEGEHWKKIADAIEAKLRSKNNG